MTDEEQKIVSWEEPPPESEGLGAYGPVITELRENPGQWARLPDRKSPEAAKSFVNNVRKGKLRAFQPQGVFDARSHENRVWVRYRGGGRSDASPQRRAAETRREQQPDRRSREEAAEIREWAEAKGYHLEDRGRLPSWVTNAYDLAVRRGEV